MLLSEAFTSSARRYDLLTRLNPGYQRELRRAARKLATMLANTSRPVIWDLGCGTGLSTRALLKTMPHAKIIGVDASAGMLEAARAKDWPEGTRFILDRVENLVANPQLDETPDGVFAAYLLRNIPAEDRTGVLASIDRKSTRLNSSHVSISYAVFCLKKKKPKKQKDKSTGKTKQ